MSAAAGGTVQVSIGAVFASTFRATFGAAESEMGKLGGAVRALDSKLSSVKGFRQMQSDTAAAEAAWRKADQELRSMSQHLAGLSSVSDQQARQFRALEKTTNALKATFESSRAATDKMGKELRETGTDTSALVAEQKRLEAQLQATSNRMKAMAGIANSGVGKAFGSVGAEMKNVATQGLVAGAGLGYFFKTNFLDVASEFERFKTMLETTEGGKDGANKAMAWISDFASKTPYELNQVTDAFVKLRAYGLDPTKGLLKTLGDTSASMGKPLMQTVEAMADAMTGQSERLLEFGIRGTKEGSKIIYEYTDKAGKQQKKAVDASNRAMIQSTLSAIWNDRYQGSMDRLSGTWEGMVSNVKDQWTRFTNNVMNAGLFDWMKAKLGGLLDTLNKMAASGELQAWAEKTGTAMLEGAKAIWAIGSAFASAAVFAKDLVGGWENLAAIIVAVKLAPLALSLGQLALSLGSVFSSVMMLVTGAGSLMTAFRVLGAFMLTNPVGIAITLLGTAAYLLWKNWDEVMSGIKLITEQVMNWITEKIEWAAGKIAAFKALASGVGDKIGGAWGTFKGWVGAGPETTPAGSGPAGAAPGPVSAVPAVPVMGGSSVTNLQAPITINGATDPQATAKAVRAELDRREREAKAANRSKMTDAMGY